MVGLFRAGSNTSLFRVRLRCSCKFLDLLSSGYVSRSDTTYLPLLVAHAVSCPMWAVPAALVTSRCDDIVMHTNLAEAMVGGWTAPLSATVPNHVVPVGAIAIKLDAVSGSVPAAPAGSESSPIASASSVSLPPTRISLAWSHPSNIGRFTQYLQVRDLGYRMFKITVSPAFVKALLSALASLFAVVWGFASARA
jgi:hypothetical protein